MIALRPPIGRREKMQGLPNLTCYHLKPMTRPRSSTFSFEVASSEQTTRLDHFMVYLDAVSSSQGRLVPSYFSAYQTAADSLGRWLGVIVQPISYLLQNTTTLVTHRYPQPLLREPAWLPQNSCPQNMLEYFGDLNIKL